MTRAKTITAALALAIATTPGYAQTPTQPHNPQTCAKSDVACIETAYAEYKAALLAEVGRWKQLETRIANLVASHNENAAAVLQGEIMSGPYYVHSKWMFPTNDQILLTKVPYGEFDALLSDCRSAIIALKYLLISLGRNDKDDQQYYRESMDRCEKQFHLDPVLGGFGRGKPKAEGQIEKIVETVREQAESLSKAVDSEATKPSDIQEKVKRLAAAMDELRAALVKKIGREAEAEEERPASSVLEEHALLCTDPLRLLFQDEKKLKTHVEAGEIETDDFSTADTATNMKDEANLFMEDLKNPNGKDCSQNWAVQKLASKKKE